MHYCTHTHTHSPAVLDHSYSSLNSSLSYTPNSQPTVDESTASKTKNINLGPRNLMDVSGGGVVFVEKGKEETEEMYIMEVSLLPTSFHY